VAEDLITILEKFLGYEYCIVGMLNEDNQILVPLAISRKDKDQETYIRDLQSIAGMRTHPGAGISGWVMQHGQLVRSGDVTNDPRYIKALEDVNSELCVPLISRGKTIGVLDIETSEPDAYTEKDENILTALASSAAIALENAKLYKSELVRRKNAEILREETFALTATVETKELFDIILSSLEKLIPYDSASIELVNQDQSEICLLDR
jgi:GAF domain-containing protein